MTKNFQEIYGSSAKENFRVIDDSIVNPHPYCIGTRLVAFTSDHHMGMLGDEAIRDAETHGIFCDMRMDNGGKCQMKYEQHEKTLTVQCKLPMGKHNKDGKSFTLNSELKKYLMSIKEQAENNGFKGYAFVDMNGKGSKII